jgi:putative oxidoreductase
MLKNCFASSLDHDTKGSAALLVARLMFGCLMAFTHGLGKLPPPEMMVEGLGSMGLPLPGLMAWAAALAEFAGGLLIAVGLLTRPAALLWVITMLVAAFVAHAADPIAKKEMALLYLGFGILLMGTGAGRFSVDYFLGKKLK